MPGNHEHASGSHDHGVGVFTEPKVAFSPRIGIAEARETVRSRVAEIDLQQIASARRGKQTLALNLFGDAVYEARIKKVRPTRTGYHLSGHLAGIEYSEFSLTVNGPLVVGRVNTLEEKFTIQPTGFGTHVIRQLDESLVDSHPSHAPYETPYLSTPINAKDTQSVRFPEPLDAHLPREVDPKICTVF